MRFRSKIKKFCRDYCVQAKANFDPKFVLFGVKFLGQNFGWKFKNLWWRGHKSKFPPQTFLLLGIVNGGFAPLPTTVYRAKWSERRAQEKQSKSGMSINNNPSQRIT